MPGKSYNAKILLFGEYTIITGSPALAIPINQFSGKWAFADKNQANILQADLNNFADYLDEICGNEDNQVDLDVKKFRLQLGEGLYFQSNIPRGYGAGSSGALCAAVFERFSKNKITVTENTDLRELKNKLAKLESFFHGSSSGIDPLICLINQPVLIKPDQICLARLPLSGDSKGAIFLLDTGIERKTEPFVRLFLEKCKDDHFAKICREQLAFYNENAIQHFLNSRWKELYESVRQISWIELEYFNEMIPEEFLSAWRKGVEQDLYQLKLCGAGGGGFILGFTKDVEKTNAVFSEDKITPIFRF